MRAYVRGHYGGKSVFHTARSLARATKRAGKSVFPYRLSLARVTERYGKPTFQHIDRAHRVQIPENHDASTILSHSRMRDKNPGTVCLGSTKFYA